MYRRVVAPPAVVSELSHPRGDVTPVKVTQLPWLEVVSVRHPADSAAWAKHLGAGESEAIVLAKEITANLVLIEDALTRRAAEGEGLVAKGVLGVLVDAKEEGRVELVRPLMDRLRRESNFFIHDRIYSRVVSLVNEE